MDHRVDDPFLAGMRLKELLDARIAYSDSRQMWRWWSVKPLLVGDLVDLAAGQPMRF
jgi:hypothetical protein